MRRFLLVDDEINILQALRRMLRQKIRDEDFLVEMHTDPQQALQRAREVAFDVVISDFHMPQMNGVDFLEQVRDAQPDATRLMLSASADFGTIMNAVNRAEVFRYIAKPWTATELEEIVRLSLERRDKIMEDRRLADAVRVQRGVLTPQALEALRLEEEEPGITKVRWGLDGSVMLD
ncbi:MAG: response regulator [Glaciimonas sp.]|nr:response regulator [Glaciimonas sp.]